MTSDQQNFESFGVWFFYLKKSVPPDCLPFFILFLTHFNVLFGVMKEVGVF